MSEPTDITADKLNYWLDRVGRGWFGSLESHFLLTGVLLVMDPHRRVLASYEGRQILVEGRNGRGWLAELEAAVVQAVAKLLVGEGEPLALSLGDVIRAEIERREAGGNAKPASERKAWIEWLEPDELPLALGAWMHDVGILSVRVHTTRNPSLAFQPSHDEWKGGVAASNARNVLWLLGRLAIERGAPAKRKPATLGEIAP